MLFYRNDILFQKIYKSTISYIDPGIKTDLLFSGFLPGSGKKERQGMAIQIRLR